MSLQVTAETVARFSCNQRPPAPLPLLEVFHAASQSSSACFLAAPCLGCIAWQPEHRFQAVSRVRVSRHYGGLHPVSCVAVILNQTSAPTQASVGSLSRDAPGGATQAKSAAGARRVKRAAAQSGLTWNFTAPSE